jgi:acyl-CoA thioester hydrolase
VDGYTFTTTVRVRFADTDAQGIAHNAAYLVWYEVARVEYLRAYVGGYQALRDLGLEALVLESHCRYVVPAVFDDLLHRYEYAIVRDDGTLMADGYTAHACVDSTTFKPTRVPDWFRNAIARVEQASSTSSSS